MRRIGISRSTSARLIRAAMAMFLAAGAFLPSRAWAYDGVTSFQVSLIELGGTDRFGFKLVNPATGQAPALCNADASCWGIGQVGLGDGAGGEIGRHTGLLGSDGCNRDDGEALWRNAHGVCMEPHRRERQLRGSGSRPQLRRRPVPRT